jgi:hypothetical protein
LAPTVQIVTLSGPSIEALGYVCIRIWQWIRWFRNCRTVLGFWMYIGIKCGFREPHSLDSNYSLLLEYVVLPPGHHGARILNLSETDILKSQKNRKKFMHVDNHDFYLYAKNQSKILCILACIKKTNIQI